MPERLNADIPRNYDHPNPKPKLAPDATPLWVEGQRALVPRYTSSGAVLPRSHQERQEVDHLDGQLLRAPAAVCQRGRPGLVPETPPVLGNDADNDVLVIVE